MLSSQAAEAQSPRAAAAVAPLPPGARSSEEAAAGLSSEPVSKESTQDLMQGGSSGGVVQVGSLRFVRCMMRSVRCRASLPAGAAWPLTIATLALASPQAARDTAAGAAEEVLAAVQPGGEQVGEVRSVTAASHLAGVSPATIAHHPFLQVIQETESGEEEVVGEDPVSSALHAVTGAAQASISVKGRAL